MALFSQSGRFRTMEARQLLFDHLNRLLAEVPVWHLKCNMDEEAAILSHRVMAGENTVLEVNHED